MIDNTMISIIGSSVKARPQGRVFPFRADVNVSCEAPFHVTVVDLDRVIMGDHLCAPNAPH